MNFITVVLGLLLLGVIVMIPMSLVLFLFSKITFTNKGRKGGKGDKYSPGAFSGFVNTSDGRMSPEINVTVQHGKGASDDDVFFTGKDAPEDPKRR